MSPPPEFQALIIALSLGMLVGLQRQWSKSQLAGIRTFALVTLMGAIAAQIGGPEPVWLIAAGLLGLVALLITGNILVRESAGSGQTTEVAMVVMYLVGVTVVIGNTAVAVVVGATVAVLLQMKEPFKAVVSRIGEEDLTAILQFAVISLIILPILPDRTFGPYDVLNARTIWLMVVLIVGINLAGYAGFRLLGQKRGTLLAGILGGLISSTATTASYARTPSADPVRTRAAAAVVLLATAVVFVRVLIEIGAVSGTLLATAIAPIGLLLVLAVGLGLISLKGTGDQEGSAVEKSNPSKLAPALFFALMYGGVLLAVAAAEDWLGGAGLYGVAALSGLTDMDAITLSTSELVDAGRVAPGTAWRAIVIAGISNLIFKGGIVVSAGNRSLSRRVGASFAVLAVASVLLIVFWPS
ncbi:MAG: MgtC/SapB family protein [Gemmatimonadetes bacterium]|nr:MgtC/SapB family protein [Gemmatimonadota bacterium]